MEAGAGGETGPIETGEGPGGDPGAPIPPVAPPVAGGGGRGAPAGEALLRAFLAESDPGRLLDLWFRIEPPRRAPRSADELRRLLQRNIAAIDERIAAQVDAVLHHPSFQRLEAAWRGLEFLVDRVAELGEGEARSVKIRVFPASWKELVKDLERAIEFDQSALYKKVYGEEFGTAGGEPFGVLLCDYEVRHRPAPDHPTDDMAALRSVSEVAAAAFCPAIFGVHPGLLGLDSFRELQIPMDIGRTFRQAEYVKWNALRDAEDSRFLGMTLPRTLMRRPWSDDGSEGHGFRYREDVTAPGGRGYLWGTAVWAFGAVLIRAFAFCGWLADIRGIQEGVLGGGVVTSLPVDFHPTDRAGIAAKCSTDVILTDQQERMLGELGFISLCRCKATSLSVFYGNPSLHRPPAYDKPSATENARLSATLQYMFCAARFAHYLKVMGREKVGSFATPEDCEEQLQRWLHDYCTSNESASLEQKARYPLREARVQVKEVPGKPGNFYSTIHLRPHFQLDQVDASVRLVTVLAAIQAK